MAQISETARSREAAPGRAAGRRGGPAWWGAVWMAAVVAVLAGAWRGVNSVTGMGMVTDGLLGAVTGAGVFILAGMVGWVGSRLLKRAPSAFTAATCGLLAVLGLTLADGLPRLLALPAAVGGMLVVLSAGAVIGLLATGSVIRLSRPGKIGFILLLLMLAAGIGGFVAWWLSPGTPMPAGIAQWTAPAQSRALDLPDPAAPGPYQVQEITYGNGAKTDLTTSTVDLAAFLPAFGPVQARLRARYWGFTPRKAPLNGRVWYPVGEGPFPLVLIVHGNARMETPSETGFAYLGRLLASRGYIVAAIDQNYLNGSWSGQVRGELPARTWGILQHLKQWRRWQQAPEKPFAGKIDLDRVALIGHSRGGEAVVLAAALSRLSRLPDNAVVRLEPPCRIRAVAALASTDGTVELAGHPLALEDVDYLLLQGGHDGDVAAPVGLRQFRQMHFTGKTDHFAAAVYCYQANHSQFNTAWGDRDRFDVRAHLLNRRALLPGNIQRQLTATWISAFLEASLRGQDGYRALWADPRASAPWLPPAACITQYRSAAFRPVATFEEDADVLTATLDGARTEAVGFASWHEQALTLRNGKLQENHAVCLGWQEGQTPARYTVTLPVNGLSCSPADRLVFALADARPAPSSRVLSRLNPSTYRLDLTVELLARNGVTARIPLSRLSRVPALPRAEITKSSRLDARLYGNKPQLILQHYAIPLREFLQANPTFPLDKLQAVCFRFDRSPSGEVMLDDVGFE